MIDYRPVPVHREGGPTRLEIRPSWWGKVYIERTDVPAALAWLAERQSDRFAAKLAEMIETSSTL